MANLSVVLALVGGALPALVWLSFWLREDQARPEPRPLIAGLFLAGAVAVLPAYLVQELLRQFWTLDATTQLMPTVIVWAASEEIIKYVVVAGLALGTRWFDEPIDAMIYMITVALGFAAAENSLFMLRVLTDGGDYFDFWLNGNFRFVGATIVHIVSSSVLGATMALAYCASWSKRQLALVAGLVGATLLHTLFNYFIIKSASVDVLKIFILFWALAVVIIYLFERVKFIACRIKVRN